MAITRWTRRAVLTATALAFALPFSTGTAQADPIIEALADNNVNLTVGAYNNNVNSIPISLGAGASLNTGSGITLGLDENEGIQFAMDIGHAAVSADAAVGVPFTNIGAEASVAAAVDVPAVTAAVDTAEVHVAAPPAEPAVAEPAATEPEVAEPAVAEPAAAAPPAPAAAPVLESAVTITDDTATVTDVPKGDDECYDEDRGDDCDDDDEPSVCPNITALGVLSVCLLPNLIQLHI